MKGGRREGRSVRDEHGSVGVGVGSVGGDTWKRREERINLVTA